MTEADEQADRISNLPDALLCEILSYLSTKEAVATSILSKRWESVWTRVPVISIITKLYGSFNGFEAFVDRVLTCNDSPSLRLFQLCVPSNHVIINDTNYQSWIRNVMQRDVVEVDLYIHNWDTLPPGTFLSEKLMVLKLTGFDSPLRDPIHLPNLLTLHLKNISSTPDFRLNDILMSLPRLEELVIQDCEELSHICIHSSSLKRLYLLNIIYWLEDDSDDEHSSVDAPSLEYLCIDDVLSSDNKFGNMPSLAEAKLYIRHYSFMVKALNKIIQGGSNLVTLELVVSAIEAVVGDNEHDQLPLFPQIPHLKRFIITGHYLSFLLRYLVLSILQRAPNLVTLDYSVTHDVKCYCPRQQVLPTCLLKYQILTLEVVNISLDKLSKADKILLKYLLNNAINLKVFKINLKHRVAFKTIAAIAGLFKVPRASSICKLVISHEN